MLRVMDVFHAHSPFHTSLILVNNNLRCSRVVGWSFAQFGVEIKIQGLFIIDKVVQERHQPSRMRYD